MTARRHDSCDSDSAGPKHTCAAHATPFDHHRSRVPWRRIAARAGTGAGREPGQRKRRSAREEVWNLAGVGTRCFDVLTSSHIQQPNTVFDCQPRLDAGALPGDDTGNAHAIQRTTLGTPGTTMSWQMANWLPTSPTDSERYEGEGRGGIIEEKRKILD